MAGRKPTEPFWTEKIRGILAADSRKSSRAIHDELMAFGASPAGTYPPAPRTIDEIKKAFFALPVAGQRQYEKAYWPESFVSGALPWDAAETTLELIKLAQTQGRAYGRPQARPSVRMARWFHRVTLAMPGAQATHRRIVAGVCAAGEVIGGLRDRDARQLEGFLAYRAWTREADGEYGSAINHGSVEEWVPIDIAFPNATTDQFAALLSEMLLGVTPGDMMGWAKAREGRPAGAQGEDPFVADLFDLSGIKNVFEGDMSLGAADDERSLEQGDEGEI